MNKFLIFINFLFNLYFIKSNLISDNYIEQYFDSNYIKAIKEDSEYFDGFLLEFEYDEINNCYKNKNHKPEYDLIIKIDNGSFIKDFKNVDGSNFEEKDDYKTYSKNKNKECGHLFKLTVNNTTEKTYIIYLSFNFQISHTKYTNKINKNKVNDILEFESICVFEFVLYNYFFSQCVNLRKAKLKNKPKNLNDEEFKNYIGTLSIVQYCVNLFSECKNLKEVDLSEFFLYKCTFGFDNMFADCEKIENLILNNPDDYTKFSSCFYNCKNIKNIDFVNKNSNIVVSDRCFGECENLENLSVNTIYLSNDCRECFKNCKKIKNLKLHIDEKHFLSGVYHEERKKLKEENLDEVKKKETYDIIKNNLKSEDILYGTELDHLTLVVADNFEKDNMGLDYLGNIVKDANIKKFTFNGYSIYIQDGVDLKEFMSDPKGYLERNPQFKYIEKPDQSYQNLENVDVNVDKNQLGCLSCCSKCCCCCCHKDKENR